MSDTNTEAFNLDSLLDGQLDDLPDLPSNDAWPAGAYKARLKLDQKTINNKPAYIATFTMLEVQEVPGDVTPPLPDATTSVLYMLDNQYGLGNFKKLLVWLAAGFNLQGRPNREILEAAQEAEVLVILDARMDKKNNVLRNNLKELAVV
jgi:hypothetical protein